MIFDVPPPVRVTFAADPVTPVMVGGIVPFLAVLNGLRGARLVRRLGIRPRGFRDFLKVERIAGIALGAWLPRQCRCPDTAAKRSRSLL